MDPSTVRAATTWAAHYQPAWDSDPAAYVAEGVVGWGKTRRLGVYRAPARAFKAYLGVQHVDPRLAGWQVDAPEARFFVSWFVAGRCLGLRVAPTVAEALALLAQVTGPRET